MIDSSSPNQPVQNYEIVNPTLESTIAQLLPSVAGYGGNLRSTNTIIPIVDVTGAAEGTQLRADLQSALSFDNVTAFDVRNQTTQLLGSPGYYRIFGNVNSATSNSVVYTGTINLSDGISTKKIIEFSTSQDGALNTMQTPFDFVVFLDASQTLSVTSSGTLLEFVGCTRQIADIDGNLN